MLAPSVCAAAIETFVSRLEEEGVQYFFELDTDGFSL